MGNHTKSEAIIEAHQDSKVFGEISPAVFQAILDVMPAISAVLNWTPLAHYFLGEVLRQISLAGNPLSLGHAEFGRILWGEEITKVAAKRRIGRAIQALMQCQAMSGFLAVWIVPGKRIEKEEGEVEFLYTTYRLREFFEVFGEIQKLAVEQDLMALPMKERKYTQRAIIQSVCDAREYHRIPARVRQQKHFIEEKQKPEPLPKVESQSPAPPAMTYTKALAWYCEQLESHLVSIGKTGQNFNAVIAEASKAVRAAERNALDVIHGRKKGVSR